MQTKISAIPYLRVFVCVLTLAMFMLVIFPQLSKAADETEHGKQLFERRCTGCHSLDMNRVGPRLRDVYGRRAGKIPNFKYSPSLQSAHIVWDDASLEQWLTDPDSLIPDNEMSFRVPKAEERAEIIRFLKMVSKR
jgi:cytochrome c